MNDTGEEAVETILPGGQAGVDGGAWLRSTGVVDDDIEMSGAFLYFFNQFFTTSVIAQITGDPVGAVARFFLDDLGLP